MKRFLLPKRAMLVCTACLYALPAHAEDPAFNPSALIHALLPTVVDILVKKDEASPPPPVENAGSSASEPSTGIKDYVGSGFVIDPSGLIVTNYHVVQNAFEITVTFSDGTRLPAAVSSASRLTDLAIVKVQADHPLPAAQWGDSDKLQVGDPIIVVGDPFGIGLSVSSGIVSGLNRNIHDSPYDDLIQTDAAINHGNSGGPLFDRQGQVVGIASDLISPTAGSVGLGFAITANVARFVTDRLRAYGWVRPGWIGVATQQVTPDIARASGMTRPEGSIVAWVVPNGPADQAGIAIGDVILRLDNSAPSDERALLRAIAATPVGDTLTLVVRHGGEQRSLRVTAAAWPRARYEAADAPLPVMRPAIAIPPDLGLSLAPVPPGDRQKLGLRGGLTGVLVTHVATGTDPARRGLVSGDVILRVFDKPVATPAQVLSEIAAARTTDRDFVLVLVLSKLHDELHRRWVPLRVREAGG